MKPQGVQIERETMEAKQKPNEARAQKPPAAYSSKGAQRAEKEKKKENQPVSIGAIISVLLILIIVSVLALVYFDLLGFKDLAVQALNLDDPSGNYLEELYKMEEEILALQNLIEEKENTIASKDKELKKRENAVTALEEELLQRQEALTQMQILVEGLKTDIGALALMVENMDAVKAAEMLDVYYNVTDVARILVEMKSESAAKVLNNMQADRAALVIAEMMRYSS